MNNNSDIFDEKGVIPTTRNGLEAVEYLNRLIWNSEIRDFAIDQYDGFRLKVVGSFDLCYYHDIEIYFDEVSFLQLASAFSDPKFELLTINQLKELPFSNIASEKLTIKIYEPDGEYVFYVNCDDLNIKSGKVIYERNIV